MCEHNNGDIYTLLILAITDISTKEMSSFNTWHKYLQLIKVLFSKQNILNAHHLLRLVTQTSATQKYP